MKHYAFENAAVRLAGLSGTLEFLAPIFADRDRELLVAAFCDDEARLLGLVSVPGTYDEVSCATSLILRRAIVAEAAGIVIAHNHPSGDQRPSDADKRFTRRLLLGTEASDITFLDHLIFDHGPVFSFRKAGLL